MWQFLTQCFENVSSVRDFLSVEETDLSSEALTFELMKAFQPSLAEESRNAQSKNL